MRVRGNGRQVEAHGHLPSASCASPEQALEYLARYTHRVAISNRRLLSVADGRVVFKYRDYRDNQTTTRDLPADKLSPKFREWRIVHEMSCRCSVGASGV